MSTCQPLAAVEEAGGDAAVAGLPGEHSLSNSAGVLGWPEAHRHWVRPGGALYGLSAVEGQWKQGPAPLPLTWKRVAKATELVRPQLPKKPYPYVAEEVTFENKKAGVKFAFESGGITAWGDFLGNAQKAVEGGLAADGPSRVAGDARAFRVRQAAACAAAARFAFAAATFAAAARAAATLAAARKASARACCCLTSNTPSKRASRTRRSSREAGSVAAISSTSAMLTPAWGAEG